MKVKLEITLLERGLDRKRKNNPEMKRKLRGNKGLIKIRFRGGEHNEWFLHKYLGSSPFCPLLSGSVCPPFC